MQLKTALERELARRAELGLHPVSVAQMDQKFRELGYCLNRQRDCRFIAQIRSGKGAGDSYPCISTGLIHIASGLGFAHYAAPRDEAFRRMMELRGSVFAISRGAILEV